MTRMSSQPDFSVSVTVPLDQVQRMVDFLQTLVCPLEGPPLRLCVVDARDGARFCRVNRWAITPAGPSAPPSHVTVELAVMVLPDPPEDATD